MRRTKSCGSLARFSAQPVSSRPISALSISSVKPASSQNWRNCGQSCSGAVGTASQRVSPARSMRMPATSDTATDGVAGCAATVLPAAAAAALTVPPGAWKRPSRASWVRSGGTSSPEVWRAPLR